MTSKGSLAVEIFSSNVDDNSLYDFFAKQNSEKVFTIKAKDKANVEPNCVKFNPKR